MEIGQVYSSLLLINQQSGYFLQVTGFEELSSSLSSVNEEYPQFLHTQFLRSIEDQHSFVEPFQTAKPIF